MKNVRECPKDIGLEIIFRNILWKNKKNKKFVDSYLYFP